MQTDTQTDTRTETPAGKFPFAVRLLGFTPEEANSLAAGLLRAPEPGPAYFCLSAHSLQEPDLFIANGDEIKALAALAALSSGDLRPALIVGTPALTLPYPSLARPLAWDGVHAELALLVARRADALAYLTAGGTTPPPERRLRERLDFDLTDPAEYVSQRRATARGAVLVLDDSPAFSANLARLLSPYRIALEWTDDEPSAVGFCEKQAVSVVLVNTAVGGIDPYRLCAALKNCGGLLVPAVVLLVAPPFVYDADQGQAVGIEGLLDKPVADQHLSAVLKKLMNIV
ncbi:response regulator [Rugamonas sp.]|uniref:response regulator n=1 Tax=Rugamonas sp. TaxID=1926287 RepID=UPI0025D26013|nr:response regulator [Rugamonas sp.]